MKNTLTFLLTLLSLATCAQEIEWIPFQWLSATLSGKRFDKAAMFIPVAIDNMHHKFEMQFDMGCNATVISGNTIKPYLHRKDELAGKIDTTLSFTWNNTKNYTFKNVDLKLGDVSFGKKNIGCLK